MKDLFEQLLIDIYELEPSLKERDLEVRQLLKLLIENKPEIKAEADFAFKLKKKLLNTKPAMVKKQGLIPSPWMHYLVPVGAAMLLLLMLVPNYLRAPGGYETVPSSAPEMFMAPESKRSFDDDAVRAATMMLEDASMEALTDNSFSINPQKPGVIVRVEYISLAESGFMVIKPSEEELSGPVGVSHLLFAGFNTDIEIPLTEPMKVGANYTAQLYLDNGDGIFNQDLDIPVYTLDGQTPLSQEFVVTN